MQELIARQKEIIDNIHKIHSNFNKDSASRKTDSYIKKRISSLDSLWAEFDINHAQLLQSGDDYSGHEYFKKDIFKDTQKLYERIKGLIQNCNPSVEDDPNPPTRPALGDLMSEQNTNFRALQRLINGIDITKIVEKRELEDELKRLQSRWRDIDNLHLKIDNISQGEDETYEQEFSVYEKKYKDTRRVLNQKISSTAHQYESTPKMDVPTFHGDYAQWPTFLDLYKSSIHDNPTLTYAQKMQHLKGKVKGEAHRLIQHLNVSSDNYKTAWDLLFHRYNNVQVLFTKNIELFLNQRAIEKQTSNEIKRIYDTTMESIHAIHNLGVDTTTWDPILVHLLVKKLDPETRTDYMESRKTPRELPEFEEFMAFLEGKFTALEPVTKKEKDWSSTNNKGKSSFGAGNKTSFPKFVHAASTTINCCICNTANHALYHCRKFVTMSPEQKLKIVTKHRLCSNCLYVHDKRGCNSMKTCRICNEKHHSLLHESYHEPNATEGHTTEKSSRQNSSNNVTSDDDEILLTTVQIRVRAIDNTYMTFRALLDQGSQITLITENVAQRLGLPRRQLNASVTGVGASMKRSKGMVKLDCTSIHGDYAFSAEALVLPKILNSLPHNTLERKQYPHIQHIQLADPDYYVSKQIDILLDAKVYSDIIMSGLIKGSDTEPIAQQTKLGWILSGRVQTFHCNVVLNGIEDIASYWEMEEITTKSNTMTKQEQFCEELYAHTTRRLPDGRYEVRLPMKEGFEKYLGHSKARAVAQFKQLENRLLNNDNLRHNYQEFIHEYEKLGHMKECYERKEPMCYLPHHGVIRESSTTTKLRVVFNASSKTSTGSSLNDLMECGPKLQRDIQELLLRWRTYEFVYTADCEKMYRCILLQSDQQQLQKIVWRDHPQDLLKEYKLCTVTYGMKAAPFLAMRTMQQLASDDQHKYPLAAEVLRNDFYVDDLLSGSHTIEQAREIKHQLIEMLKGAKINLRKWCSNNCELLSSLSNEHINPSTIDFKNANSTNTLGLQWNPATDMFTFHRFEESNKMCTKRIMLSNISKIFDPLGWLSPLTIRAKLLFQKIWMVQMEWDDIVPEDIRGEWNKLLGDLQNIDKIIIPRWTGNLHSALELHGFCDASERAFAAVIYLKSVNAKGYSTVRMMASKTKLAPRKNTMTLPRLELCGALLLSKLLEKVMKAVSQTGVQIYCWTDSLVVLGWLKGNPSRWKAFVANRTKEILDIAPSSCWRHVSSSDNAADCATRGLTTSQLLQHTLWWEGPAWIKDDIPSEVMKLDLPQMEVKRNVQTYTAQRSYSIIEDILNKHSSITYVVRVIARVLRFLTNLRHRGTKHCSSPSMKHNTLRIACDAPDRGTYLTAIDIENAYEVIIKAVQTTEFQAEILRIRQGSTLTSKSNLLPLDPYLDDKNILRVGGRLQHSKLKEHAKHPMIIPKDTHLTGLLIQHAHLQTLHGGPSLTLAYLRQRYWVLGGIRTVKKYLRNCVKCVRFNRHNHYQKMAELPEPRVTPSRPFTHTGVDFTGQVELKANKGRGIKITRGYIAVFVCFATKAIHLELVSDLSTPAFLAALKRMCARRGTPKHIYSDNGTNFVGASRLLRKEYKEVLEVINQDCLSSISEMGVTWHLNAPAWPSAGGIWEAAVKSTKHHLKRVLGEQKLTFEEFTTLLAQIEACLNSRPLYALTEDAEDHYLTPGHFLIGGPLLSPPMTDLDPRCIRTRWQLTEKMHRDFWRKWSADYLQHLQTRAKWHHSKENLKIDEVVLIREDNLPPTKWALGRVREVHPGLDGHVRVATLKTKSGEIKRPIIKLIPLPIHTKNDNPDTSTEDVRVDYPLPRKRRPTAKVNLVMATMLLLLTFLVPAIEPVTKIKPIGNNNTLYFDTLSKIRIIQDHWKMIAYYNMTTYWHNMKAVEKYIYTIGKACQNDSFCLSVVTQFEHELNEINHYNDLLMNNHHLAQRRKRGLINAIGNVANSLFGVLDDKFAQQYEKDIDTLTHREDHLLSLYKNQTSILEAENNILKRNEAVMNKQFDNIYKNLKVLSTELNQIASQNNKITASWISADVIISNLRRTQETLLDIVTDIYHGRLNIHLLSPQQIQQQLNVISGQLQGDVIVPADNARDLYGLLHVRVTVTRRYLIMEITIPLINRDLFELSKVIELPQREGNQTYIYTKTETKYLAINVKKDTVIPMTDNDIQACKSHTNQQLLCPLSHPVFTMQVGESLCNKQLFTTNENKPYCRPEIKQCSDRWVKLHTRNTWLYSCCTVCSIRIICPNEIVTKTLRHNGLISLEKGCVIKGEAFLIYAEHDYTNEIYMKQDNTIDLPNSSTLNELMSVPLSDKFVAENHNKTFAAIQQKIDAAKQVELETFTHDYVHYIVIYTILFIVSSLLLTILVSYARFRWYKRKSNEGKPGSTTAKDETSSIEVRVEPKREDDSKQTKRTNLVRRTQSNVDIATSPGLPRTIKFNLSASTSNLSNQ